MSANGSRERLLHVMAAVVVSFAAVKFFSVTHHDPPPDTVATEASARTLEGAPGYGELRENPRGENAAMRRDAFGQLPGLVASASQRVATRAEHESAVQDRLKRRAFSGAPPTIPHEVPSRSTASCLACHGEGKRIADRVAPPMSHGPLQNCTQCHVTQAGEPWMMAGDPLASSTFVGLARWGLGTRAPRALPPGLGGSDDGHVATSAPPTVPHPTQMRERCASCHGPAAAIGLRTSHPHRVQCTQCHVPSAFLDQRASVPPVFP